MGAGTDGHPDRGGPPAGLRTERSGLSPLLSASADTVVAGVDDRHLDFRLVLHVRPAGEGRELVAVTVVRRHNALGRAYFAVVRPFHARVVPAMLRRLVERSASLAG